MTYFLKTTLPLLYMVLASDVNAKKIIFVNPKFS